jgi:hypothetical protein
VDGRSEAMRNPIFAADCLSRLIHPDVDSDQERETIALILIAEGLNDLRVIRKALTNG